MDRVENGETIGVVNENGDKAVMVPVDDEPMLVQIIQKHLKGVILVTAHLITVELGSILTPGGLAIW